MKDQSVESRKGAMPKKEKAQEIERFWLARADEGAGWVVLVSEQQAAEATATGWFEDVFEVVPKGELERLRDAEERLAWIACEGGAQGCGYREAEEMAQAHFTRYGKLLP